MSLKLQWNIIKTFAGKDQNFFSYNDVCEEYPNTDTIYLSKVLSKMIDTGMLIKLSHGLYCIVPTEADAKNFMPDWHLSAKYLIGKAPYYIGYYAAMQIHGLIVQPSLKEIVVTDRQVNPSIKKIRGVEFQFVTHTKTKFFGFKKMWINKFDQVMVSDLEKTIVDAVTRPNLCGGIVEIGRAIFESKDKIDVEKIHSYFVKNKSQAAIKRYLYLCDLLKVAWTTSHETMSNNLSTSFSLLDTTGPNEGKKNSKFRLKINIDTTTIKNAIYT